MIKKEVKEKNLRGNKMKEINVKYFKKVNGQVEWLNKELASYGEKLSKKMPNPMGVNGKSLKEVFSNTFGLEIKLDNTNEWKQIDIYFSQPSFGHGDNWTYYYKAIIVPNKVIFCFENKIKDIMIEFGKKFEYETFIFNDIDEDEQTDMKYGNDMYYEIIEIVRNPLKILKQYGSERKKRE